MKRYALLVASCGALLAACQPDAKAPASATPVTTKPETTTAPIEQPTASPEPTSNHPFWIGQDIPAYVVPTDPPRLLDSGTLPPNALAQIRVESGMYHDMEVFGDGDLLLLDTDAGTNLYTLPDFRHVWYLPPLTKSAWAQLSPDQTTVTMGAFYSDLSDLPPRTYDASDGNLIAIHEGTHSYPVYSPDGALIALRELPPLPPNGDDIASQSTPASIWLVDAHTGQRIRVLIAQVTDYEKPAFYTIAWSPDGQYIAGCDRNLIHIWNATSGAYVRALEVYNDHYLASCHVDFSPDGSVLMYHGILQNTEDGTSLYVIDEAYGSSKWTDEGVLLSVTDGTFRFIEQGTWREVWHIDRNSDYGESATFAPSGETFVTTLEFEIKAYNTSDQTILWQKTFPPGFIYWSPGEDLLLSSSRPNAIGVFDARTGEGLGYVEPNAPGFRDVRAVLRNDAEVIFANDERLYLFDARSGEIVNSARLDVPVQRLAWTEDGTALALLNDEDDTAWVWDAATGNVAPTTRNKLRLNPPTRVAIGAPSLTQPVTSPDGTRTARTRDYEVGRTPPGQYVIIKDEGGNDLFRFEGHMGNVLALLFSPDGSMLASVGDDGTVIVWNVGE